MLFQLIQPALFSAFEHDYAIMQN